jgi:GxxExxY protein
MSVDEWRKLAQDIYETLGSGFDEVVYQRAFEVELRLRRLHYEPQRVVPVFYKDHYVGEGEPDLIVDDGTEKVVIELKAVISVGEKERRQLQTYLRMLAIPRGFLINFPQPAKNEAAKNDIEFDEILPQGRS